MVAVFSRVFKPFKQYFEKYFVKYCVEFDDVILWGINDHGKRRKKGKKK